MEKLLRSLSMCCFYVDQKYNLNTPYSESLRIAARISQWYNQIVSYGTLPEK